ncbi:putative alpha-1,6-mannanase (GH76 family) [Kribbella aluminosa]|uniref:Alpha-1,6-mannanase (GH76 family) n=1 Tax=Kribbella aluminosa TaxID=416017 RepID=A0ABS4UYU4_9ACTN|nr:glycoside hydrolase family 76 protein [Kribbella aluminosa]MBP2356796.1 putative alpha-1,6-mannanase (GH76 family) [Kribbella aluminosa]
MPVRRRTFRLLLAGAVTLALGLVSPPAGASPGQAASGPAASGPAAVARARVAADQLMSSYEPNKAWFPSSWWNSAVALQTIGDYMQRTGDRRYLPQLDNTFEKDKGAFPAGYLSGDELLGNFTSRAIDDSEWWGLTWVQAYDVTKNPKYLDMAVKIAEYVEGYWDPGSCGGGVWWNAERTYKNAVTNGLWIRLTAELHNRMPHDTRWLGRAQEGWNWFTSSGMINSAGLVNDGLKGNCQSNGDTVWSYNQGLAIGAGLELWRATHDPKLLTTVRRLADAAIAPGGLVTDGVLAEYCDAPSRTCDDNGKQFKGIFMRYWTDLADTTHDRRYTDFVAQQAATVWDNDRDASDRLGERWSGQTPNVFDWRTQASALSALLAAVPARPPVRSLSATTDPALPVVMPATGAGTHLKVTVDVQATGPAGDRITANVQAAAPSGWTVTPARATVTLKTRGNAVPVHDAVQLDVTIPAGTPDGSHSVTATVTSGPLLSYSTRSDILIAHKADFDTGTSAETPWLHDADGSQSNGVQNRFADGHSYFVYRFPFPSDAKSASVLLTIDNEFLVQLSGDGQTWTTVATETNPYHDGQNKADRTFDLTPYLGAGKAGYVRISDSFPDDGWGGRVYHVTATYN